MNGFEEIDWEAAVDFVKRFGGILIAVLWALAARRRKKASKEKVPALEVAQESPPAGVSIIEPGTDATKLSSQYSQQTSVPPGSSSPADW